MDDLMSYDDLIVLGQEIAQSNAEVGTAIQQLTAHIMTTDAAVFGSTETITLGVLILGLAAWVLRLAFKIARLQGQISGRRSK